MRWTIGNPTIAALVVFGAAFVVLLDVPENPGAVIFSHAAFVPLAAVFLSLVKSDLLPRGWQLVGSGGWALLRVYLYAAALVAVVLDYPLIAYAIIGRAVPAQAENRRALVVELVAAATLLFAAGILLGYFFVARFWVFTQTPSFEIGGPIITISTANFYLGAFGSVLTAAAIFLIPSYVVVSQLKNRSTRRVHA